MDLKRAMPSGWRMAAAAVLCAAGVWTALPARALEAGAAKMEITAPVGAPLNGYGDRMGRSSTGVHDPLWARSLFLDDGTTQVMLTAVDLCAVNPELRARVLELAPENIPPENIILTATHTHNGQGAMMSGHPFRMVSGRFMPEVVEVTARGIAQSMHEAYNRRRRAAIGYGAAKQTVLSVNRRYPNGPIDEQIGVLLVEDADGAAIAIVGNFAAHPTSIPHESHYLFSADYPGFYYDEIERLASEGCVALFWNGTEGNQTTAAPEGTSGWARTEAVGRLLAVRVKGVANELTCGDAQLRVASATATLPPTLGSSFMPREVELKTLEINDLLINFWPGEPCVELGIELRRRALERGYAAQFSVGLANDYLLYFVPRSLYSEFNYEAAMNFYGPGIESWFYREFSKLESKGEPEPGPTEPPAAYSEEQENALFVRLEGDANTMGVQRGRFFADEIQAAYDSRIAGAVESGAFKPETGLWSYWPSFLNPAPLALPAMGMKARTLLKGMPDPLFSELEGMAQGARMPFDALWLLQNAAQFSMREDKAALFQTPLCTIFAAVGDRAGADGLLVGRNLDWEAEERAVVIEERPSEGHAFLQVGFPWNAGVFTGMNDAGLIVALERVPALGVPPEEGIPAEFAARHALQSCSTLAEGLAVFGRMKHLRGYHVFLAGFSEENKPDAAVLSLDAAQEVRRADAGLLTGSLHTDPATAPDTAQRYGRVVQLLQEERIVGRTELEEVLQDAHAGATESGRIWNGRTRHSVVFDPGARTLYAAFPRADGAPSEYRPYSLTPADKQSAADKTQ